jgi:hypothetical protein
MDEDNFDDFDIPELESNGGNKIKPIENNRDFDNVKESKKEPEINNGDNIKINNNPIQNDSNRNKKELNKQSSEPKDEENYCDFEEIEGENFNIENLDMESSNHKHTDRKSIKGNNAPTVVQNESSKNKVDTGEKLINEERLTTSVEIDKELEDSVHDEEEQHSLNNLKKNVIEINELEKEDLILQEKNMNNKQNIKDVHNNGQFTEEENNIVKNENKFEDQSYKNEKFSKLEENLEEISKISYIEKSNQVGINNDYIKASEYLSSQINNINQANQYNEDQDDHNNLTDYSKQLSSGPSQLMTAEYLKTGKGNKIVIAETSFKELCSEIDKMETIEKQVEIFEKSGDPRAIENGGIRTRLGFSQRLRDSRLHRGGLGNPGDPGDRVDRSTR